LFQSIEYELIAKKASRSKDDIINTLVLMIVKPPSSMALNLHQISALPVADIQQLFGVDTLIDVVQRMREPAQ
jgi:hypothetical protein